jgi:hypothetical protein
VWLRRRSPPSFGRSPSRSWRRRRGGPLVPRPGVVLREAFEQDGPTTAPLSVFASVLTDSGLIAWLAQGVAKLGERATHPRCVLQRDRDGLVAAVLPRARKPTALFGAILSARFRGEMSFAAVLGTIAEPNLHSLVEIAAGPLQHPRPHLRVIRGAPAGRST